MNYSYKTFFQNLYRQQGQRYAFCARDEKEAAGWQREFRAALEEKLGIRLLREIQTKPGRDGSGSFRFETALLEEVQEDGYRRRKYVMNTLPEVYMPFYMLIPDGTEEETLARAMIAVPAHGANKNTVCRVGETPEERAKIQAAPAECYGREFVKRGYVVFCPDPPGYGERTEPIPREDPGFLAGKKKNSLESSCKDLAQTAEALGLSLTGLEVWDLMRLLDFACQSPEVRKEDGCALIGCAGFSGGGQYAMWLAALDERIRMAVVSGYVHGYYDSMLECHLCPCNYAPDLWRLGDISDICSLIAPRPLFVENGTRDVENGPCGIDGPKKQVEKIRQAYALFGAQEKLYHFTPEGEHRWYGGCYAFAEQYLAGTDSRYKI